MDCPLIESFQCFKIDKNHPDFEGLAWVAKARSLNGFRYDLNKILCQKGKLIATDGTRMHIYTMELPENIPIGAYIPIVRNNGFMILRESNAENYPDWKKVIPKTKKKTVLEKVYIGTDELLNARGFAVLLKSLDEIMQYKFFLDLASNEWRISVYPDQNSTPIRFETYKPECKKVALIMARRT